MVLKLKLPNNQKAGVAGIFALGFFVIISSSKNELLRLKSTRQVV